MIYQDLIKKLLLSLVISTAHYKPAYVSACDGLFIDQQYYNVNIIKEGLNRIYQIVYNSKDNTVYFTFDQIADFPTRELGYLKLDTEEAGVIGGVKNATGLALDQGINRLYVGGSEGLFMFNLNNNRSLEGNIVKDDIISIFLKNSAVYFINRKKIAYKYEFGSVSPVFELISVAADKMVVDNDNNLFYLQGKQLYTVKMGSKIVTPFNQFEVNDINVNSKSKPYVCARDGVYFYDKRRGLEKVSDNLKNLKKIAFVNDDPLYTVNDKLVRLTKNPIPCLGD